MTNADKVIDDMIDGHAVSIHQSSPINIDYRDINTKPSSSGAILLCSTEEKLRRQEKILKAFPLRTASGQVGMKKSNGNWTF